MPKNVKQVLDEAWADHINNEEKARRFNVQKLIDYYNGDQEKYMTEFINLEKNLDKFPYYWTPITKRVINKRAEVYKLAPNRYFGDTTEIDKKYTDITKKKNIRLKVGERQARLLGTIGLRPIVVTEPKPHFDYTMLRDFQVLFEVSNTKPVAVRFPVSTAANERDIIYDYWTDEEHILLSHDNVVIKDPIKLEQFNILPDGSNPYKVIPYVWLHSEEIIDDFWNTGGNADDLVVANLHINMKLTEMSHKYRFKSFDPTYITGVDTKSKDIKMAYNHVMAIDAPDAKVGSLSTAHMFADDLEVIKFEIQLIERNYHLKINWGVQGSAPSGFSLVVQDMDHMSDLEDFTDVARDWEDDLVEMERRIAEVDKLSGVPTEELRVDFTEIRQPISQDEKNKKWTFEFVNKLSTRRDYWKSENPDISEQEMDQREEALTEEAGKLKTSPTVEDLLNPTIEEE